MRADFKGLTSLAEDFQALGLVSGATETTDGEGAEQLDERRRLQRVGKTYKAVTVHRTSAKAKRTKKKYARSAKGRRTAMRRERRQSHGKGLAMKKRWAAKLAQKHGEGVDLHAVKNSALVFMRKAANVLQAVKENKKGLRVESFFRRKSALGSAGEISAMLEELTRLTSGLVESEGQNVVKAFANVALIADMLRERFEGLAELMAEVAMDEEMSRIARVLGALAEDASAIAKGVNEGVKDNALAMDVPAVSEAFRTQMDLLLAGLDVYANFSDGPLAEEDEGEGDEDEDEDEGDEESDDESEDEGDEGDEGDEDEEEDEEGEDEGEE